MISFGAFLVYSYGSYLFFNRAVEFLLKDGCNILYSEISENGVLRDSEMVSWQDGIWYRNK
jgi:hypothetical protein